MLIIRDAQMQALQTVILQQRIAALVVEIQGDFPEAAQEAGEDEIRAAIAQAIDAGPGVGFESWAGVSMLAKVVFLLGEVPWDVPALAAILRETDYKTEAQKMQAFTDAVAAHIDGVAAT